MSTSLASVSEDHPQYVQLLIEIEKVHEPLYTIFFNTYHCRYVYKLQPRWILTDKRLKHSFEASKKKEGEKKVERLIRSSLILSQKEIAKSRAIIEEKNQSAGTIDTPEKMKVPVTQ